ncbi:MAG: peroxiredoxin [Candidatus Krumholzibacteria bacterium]|jgi:peroxiredoxin (alkyl hydroperoxide reductase subunit C)|nr:peroxiredoxin [Candidatus Krumholzibacteria bacterium]MDP6797746.1 peroxiredoxin [Candidatus Krumholzibacteria bacterium]MDP7022240.1 peroxiredoxin [Candidatus Krumholzibacteria bacterium]
MSVQVGQAAPDFSAVAVMGNNEFKEDFKLSDFRGKYVALFFYPLDFTFVCPTEIIEFNRKLEDFRSRGVEVIGVSIDSQFSHWAWKNTVVNDGGIGDIQYPLVADIHKTISRDYGVLIEEAGIALRGTFLIDKEGIVQHATVNALGLGRNIDETLRMVDALKHLEAHGEVCPAGWTEGDEAMTPSSEGVASYLTKHAG